MEFLNLSLGQFLATFGAIAAIAVAVYLLDRTRRKLVVSTLRFWVEPGKAAPVTRRNRIQQPLSLLLQLIGMALLLLAIAEFQFGGRQGARRDHVLVLDTSAWMGALLPKAPNRNDATLMDLVRANALGWLRAVPTADRVLVVRADALATPATPWETDRRNVARAILESQPGATALNLSQSLQFASQLQRSSGSVAGEIVYVGPGRISTHEANSLSLPSMPAFRVLAIDDNIENSGLRSVNARRSSTDTGAWDVLVRARNYGRRAKSVKITLNFANVPQGSRPLDLAPGEEREATFTVHTRAAGILEARLYPVDAFGADNYAALELPELRSLHVIVYTSQPDAVRPALSSDPRVVAEIRPTAQYNAQDKAGLVVLHRFRPPVMPQGNVLWIDPPVDQLTFPVKQKTNLLTGLKWTPDQPLTLGLRARDVQIEMASIFETGKGDVRLAEVDRGPIMLVRGSTVVMGFDPFDGAMRYELATPLLLANVLRWAAPDVFRDVDVGTQSAGAVSMAYTGLSTGKAKVQVVTDAGVNLPFNVRDKSVDFFAGEASRVRVIAGNSERVYSLTLPEMWDVKWTPPATARHGIPAWNDVLRRNRDWWPWLAALGALVLVGEWIAYGRFSPVRLRVVKPRLEKGGMTFDRTWVLFFLALPIAWLAWEWGVFSLRLRRKQRQHAHLLLKVAMIIAVILALAEPSIVIRERKVALAVLVDTSASVTDADLSHESALLKQINSARGRNQINVIPFARAPRSLDDKESDFNFGHTSGIEGRGTNLEAPIRQALASLPAGMLHRIALITDGNENDGAVTRAAWQAQQNGVAIDTIALAGRVQPQLKTEAVGIPGAVFSGERFPVDLTIFSPRAIAATVELSAEGKQIGVHQIALEAGENRVRIRTSLNAAGAIDLSGKIAATGLGESRFEDAVAVRRPRVQWVSEDPEGTEGHIVDVLTANRFDVVQSKALPANLDGTQLVAFNNIDLDALPPADKQRLETFVQGGGGALLIAGEHNSYVDHKGAPEDPLARSFPAKLVPPRSPQGTSVVLIIDKSSSMEGKKIELARLAAIGVVENLKPDDRVGVLIFDNSFTWAVPIRSADNKAVIKREISGIIPDGGTQIAPALTEAYRKILPTNAAYKHIVLLTDGISEEGDSLGLSKDAATNHVTISTVGLGQDVNRSYLEKIATVAKGKSYILNEPAGLEQILLKDVQEHTGTTAIEKAIKAEVKHPSDLLDKVDMEHAPDLSGYVRFETRPTADEILQVDGMDPLLVRWQYGLGRTAVFSSDAKSRWAAAWLKWPGFDRLWTNIFRDLLPHGNESEAVARYDSANQELVVDYHLSERALEPATPPDLYVIGPGDFKHPLDLARLSPGTYRGRLRIGTLEGLFRVRPLNESRAFPEVGLYRQESELSDYGSNETLLKAIAQSTGGRFNPTARQLFDSSGKYIDSTLRLWPALLGIGLLLNLIELVLRKWRGIVESLRGGRAAETRIAA